MTGNRRIYLSATGAETATADVLVSVAVNTGADSATLTLADDGGTFAVIDASSPSLPRLYNLALQGSTITATLAGGNADVTIVLATQA